MIELICQQSNQENKIAISFNDSVELVFDEVQQGCREKATVAQIVVSDQIESGRILMGSTMRINASVSEGEGVEISAGCKCSPEGKVPAAG